MITVTSTTSIDCELNSFSAHYVPEALQFCGEGKGEQNSDSFISEERPSGTGRVRINFESREEHRDESQLGGHRRKSDQALPPWSGNHKSKMRQSPKQLICSGMALLI